MSVTVEDPGRVTSEEGSPARRRAEDERLLRRYHSDGDLRAREAVIARFLPLARRLASRYLHAGEPYEDLVQVASVGLVKAVDRYDPSRGNRFVSYAIPTMLGELKRHFRDKGWSIRVPRGTQELVVKVSEAMGVLPAKLGRHRGPATSPRPSALPSKMCSRRWRWPRPTRRSRWTHPARAATGETTAGRSVTRSRATSGATSWPRSVRRLATPS